MRTSKRSMSAPYGKRWAPWRIWTLRTMALLLGVGSLFAGLARTSVYLPDIVVGIALVGGLLVELVIARHRVRSGG